MNVCIQMKQTESAVLYGMTVHILYSTNQMNRPCIITFSCFEGESNFSEESLFSQESDFSEKYCVTSIVLYAGESLLTGVTFFITPVHFYLDNLSLNGSGQSSRTSYQNLGMLYCCQQECLLATNTKVLLYVSQVSQNGPSILTRF